MLNGKLPMEEIFPKIKKLLESSNKILVLTGAGTSAESGIPTFRGKDGLWKNFGAEELATPEAFSKNPVVVWEWYNWRREIISKANPNPGHLTLTKWEKIFPSFCLITQNVDGLHRKAGSVKIIEMHGNIWEMRCTLENKIFFNQNVPLREIPPKCKDCNNVLRPNVVWFGESIPSSVMKKIYEHCSDSDFLFVIGTSAIVYPAAQIPYMVMEKGGKICEINIEETPLTPNVDFFLKGKSGEILSELDNFISKD